MKGRQDKTKTRRRQDEDKTRRRRDEDKTRWRRDEDKPKTRQDEDKTNTRRRQDETNTRRKYTVVKLPGKKRPASSPASQPSQPDQTSLDAADGYVDFKVRRLPDVVSPRRSCKRMRSKKTSKFILRLVTSILRRLTWRSHIMTWHDDKILSFNCRRDRKVWHFDRHDMFCVKWRYMTWRFIMYQMSDSMIISSRDCSSSRSSAFRKKK